MLRFSCLSLLLLWCCGLLGLVCGAINELEYDTDVAPPDVAPQPSFNLWHNFMAQMRQAFQRFQPTISTTTTKQPQIQLRSTTTESSLDYDTTPDQKFYGALNPIYQTLNF